ncbi:MAG TPA: LysM peptidoglycan-binding domain-containing protein [Anaerolineae bacterium]|nr:LysM peptidoglycan-binding domain-containing protein [Anaerolineae bacterium]
MKCPNCGATFRGGRGRCPACGYRVQAKQLIRRCPNCRARVAEGAKTCLMCGAAIDGGRSFLPQISLSMVPPAPLLGALLAIVMVAALWFVKPWRAIHLGIYNTPTATTAFTATPTSTATATSTPTAPPTDTPTPQVTTYVVRSGDTLSLIAAQFDVSVQEIMEANNLTDATILVGQELRIPIEAPAPASSAEAGQTPGAQATQAPAGSTYVVQPGDSLLEVATRFNVSLTAIMEANGITNPDTLQEGQELVIPGVSSSNETPGIGGPPTPTIPSQFRYAAPLPLAPPDESEFRDEDAEGSVLLNWLSVGLLADDEWYSVAVRYVTGDETSEWEIPDFIKATSYRVPAEMRPPEDAESHLFEWQIGVVRLVEREAEENPDVVPIAPQSETRSFYWH